MQVKTLRVFLLTFFVHLSAGAKILLLPYSFGSHINQQVTIGNELVKRGHEVHLVLSDTFPDKAKYEGGKIHLHLHHSPDPDIYTADMEEVGEGGWVEVYIGKEFIEDTREDREPEWRPCTNILSDQALYRKLQSLEFDLGILDAFPFGRCFSILFYRLGIPFVSMTTIYEPWLLRNPALPSFVPTNLLPAMTPEMSFWERLSNLVRQVEWHVSPRATVLTDEWVREYAPERPYLTLNALVGQSLLWFIEADFTLDYPRPVMPNEILVGGLSSKPAKPLPADLEAFVSENPLGTIVVSFGSMPFPLPDYITEKLMQTFTRLKQNVVWRYPGDIPSNVPSHIRLMSWLPQNDILAHNNTKVFVTHCGNGGQYEALYHGIPMVGLPMFADQVYNAKRITYKGFGEGLNIKTFTPDELEASITKILSNPSYKDSISLASKVYRSQPMTSLQRAVWWIEHVLDTGGQHYRSYALDMPWYQYLMLDVLGFLLLVCVGVVGGVGYCVCKCLGLGKKRKQKVN